MIFPPSPPRYDPQAERDRNRTIELADAQNHKTGRDIEVGLGCRIVLTDDNGVRWFVSVSTVGALTVSAT